MKKRILSLSISVFLVFLLLSCATGKGTGSAEAPSPVHRDYAAELTLDELSSAVRCKATVKAFVDGDTTHFLVPSYVSPDGILKARYLAVNTPESTGKIEEWGKTASRFTREKLESAESIIIESDNGEWNLDSTGGRYLVWVWYRESSASPYRCLNVELLQEGLAIPSSSANNRYGSVCTAAIAQAQSEKKCVWSGEKDPDFYYGDAVPVTLKELRVNAEAYSGVKVSFEGVVSRNWNNSVFIEDWDEECGCAFGIGVYYGYSLPGAGLEIISVGNRVKIVGTVQYYEAGGTYQVSGLKYRAMKPDDSDNIRLISTGNSPVWAPVSAADYNNRSISVINGDDVYTMTLSTAARSTTIEMGNLYVADVYVTTDESSSQKGALTLTCYDGEEKVMVRTVPLLKADGTDLGKFDVLGREITVRGVVDTWNGESQIKVFRIQDLSIDR